MKELAKHNMKITLYLNGIFSKYEGTLEMTNLNCGFTVAGKLCGILCIRGASVLR